MSADVAFENLMTALLLAVKQARSDGDESALMAYFDMLDVGLREAEQNDVQFKDVELRGLDPYPLIAGVKRKKAAA